MIATHSDFAKLRSRLADPIARALYERREEPGIESIAAAMDRIGDGFKTFKTNIDDRLKIIEERGEKLETRMSRPGAFTHSTDVDDTRAADPEGVITLTREDMKTRAGIAARLGVTPKPEVRMSDFMRAVAGMAAPAEVRALAESTDSTGGYATPDVLLPGILAALAPASSVLDAGANLVKLTDPAQSFAVAGISTIPVAAWRSEAGSVAESDPAFRGLTIIPRSLAFYFKISRELLQDAPGLEDALNNVIAQSFARAIDKAALLGSGTAPEPRGLANISGVNAVSSGTNGSALADYSGLVKAMTAVQAADAPTPSAAIMAPRTSGDFAGLSDTTGQPLAMPKAIANWDFPTSSQIPITDTVGTSSDCSRIFVGDFRNFSVYMRESLSIQLLREAFATTGQVAFLAHARVDVAALYPAAFAIINGVRPAA